VNVNTGEFQALTAEVDRIGKMIQVLCVRVEESLAYRERYSSPVTGPAPARQARPRGPRPSHLRAVK